MALGKEKNLQDNFLSYRLFYVCVTPTILFFLAWNMFAKWIFYYLKQMY